MDLSTLNQRPHRRQNSLTGEWILVSPQRTRRPWQGEVARVEEAHRPAYDPDCYLCPGNRRANGEVNPDYEKTHAFTNDFSAIMEGPQGGRYGHGLLRARSETGLCRVVNFSPRHDLTLAEMDTESIHCVVDTWCDEFASLAADPHINHVQIFENKGAMMGNSNPHPHCQIWAQACLPSEPAREQRRMAAYLRRHGSSLLLDYLQTELDLGDRIVWQNDGFVILVPWWAVWPYETLILPRRAMKDLLVMTPDERRAFAEAIRVLTVKYDNIFQTSFPYSSGIHQAPCDGRPHDEWQMHMHFFPPLLRSAQVKKHMVGYEMLAEPQRDITPEASAEVLRAQGLGHYKQRGAT